MGIKGLHHIAVQTDNFKKSVAFYQALGLETYEIKKFKTRDFAWLGTVNAQIELYSKKEGSTLEAWSDHYSGPVHIAFEVDDFDAFLERMSALGFPFHPSHPEPFTPPVEKPKRIAYLLGPDGEEVEIREG